MSVVQLKVHWLSVTFTPCGQGDSGVIFGF